MLECSVHVTHSSNFVILFPIDDGYGETSVRGVPKEFGSFVSFLFSVLVVLFSHDAGEFFLYANLPPRETELGCKKWSS